MDKLDGCYEIELTNRGDFFSSEKIEPGKIQQQKSPIAGHVITD